MGSRLDICITGLCLHFMEHESGLQAGCLQLLAFLREEMSGLQSGISQSASPVCPLKWK